MVAPTTLASACIVLAATFNLHCAGAVPSQTKIGPGHDRGQRAVHRAEDRPRVLPVLRLRSNTVVRQRDRVASQMSAAITVSHIHMHRTILTYHTEHACINGPLEL